jgi:PAS domain S-box-containing protein
VGVWTDVTERKQTEEILRESERRFREMLENVEFIAMTLDKNGMVTFCNDHLLRLTGWKREEVIGTDWFSKFIPDANAEVKNLFFETIEAGEIPTHYENPIKTREGGVRMVRWNNTMLRDGTGNIVGTASLGEDVTEQKQAEQRLREQADIIDRARDAVIIRDFSTEQITFWNSGAERLYGWSAREAIGRRIGELVFASEEDRRVPLQVLLSTGQFHGEIKQITKDGREIIVEGRATIVSHADGTPRSVLLIHTDITEQKSLEMQLLRAQRLESIGTLASGVAHDLNNILTPILMCAEVLRRKPDPEDFESSIALIDESARRGATIVKQVLTFARGVEGKRVLIKPNHLIEEMMDIARRTFPKSIEIDSRYSQDLWSIEGDPTQLHQVLLNLSVNARDAMPKGGTLMFGAENFEVDENYAAMSSGAKVGPHVMLRISDNGQGMPREVTDKIFDPFFTTKEMGKGTGLGLSTALGIVKSHGGFMFVDSEIGKGTTFKIFLPATVTEADLHKSKTAVAPVQGEGEQILLVDDEPNILQITKVIFEKYNYRVLSASDGPEALALFAQQKDSIGGVLTDIAMPYMDGVALVRALRKMKADIPIIASTGQGEQAGIVELESLGVKNFLTKPYDIEKLLETVHDALEGRPTSLLDG